MTGKLKFEPRHLECGGLGTLEVAEWPPLPPKLPMQDQLSTPFQVEFDILLDERDNFLHGWSYIATEIESDGFRFTGRRVDGRYFRNKFVITEGDFVPTIGEPYVLMEINPSANPDRVLFRSGSRLPEECRGLSLPPRKLLEGIIGENQQVIEAITGVVYGVRGNEFSYLGFDVQERFYGVDDLSTEHFPDQEFRRGMEFSLVKLLPKDCTDPSKAVYKIKRHEK